MMRIRSGIHALAIGAVAMFLLPASGMAQEGMFTPRLSVNGEVITEYEYFQRRLFLALLRTEGDIDKLAEEALIEDRLRVFVAAQMGLALSSDQVLAGMAEFSARANMTTEEFVKAIGEGGIAGETYRDFVASGLVWREVVRQKFGPRVAVSEAEVDRALAYGSMRGLPARVLISELFVPAPANKRDEAEAFAKGLSARLRGEAAFAAAAREHSSATSAEAGGDLGWRSVADLPPAARAALQGLRAGQVSQPVDVGGAFAIFYLRALEEAAPVSPEGVWVEYAEYLLPAGADAADIAGLSVGVDSCFDLYGVARDEPEDRLTFTRMPAAQLAPDIAREIEGLDEGEASSALTRGAARVFLMLCRRQAGGPDDMPSREAMRNALTNERLNAFSELYMAELKSEALILRGADASGG